MKKPIILTLAVAAALTVSGKQAMKSTASFDEPEYTILGNDTTCRIFVYSPNEHAGLHLAYYTDEGKWKDAGQLCSSDYGQWGREKRMFNPHVTKANDGTWRAVWSVNDYAPCFAAAYSEDLITWRPQDYPVLKEKGITEPVVYQMDDGSFDIYVKTKQGKRYVRATEDFRTFEEDSIEAFADDLLWQRDTATVNGKLMAGNVFEVPNVHLQYILNWQQAMAEEGKAIAERWPSSKDVTSAVSGTITIDKSKTKNISDRLYGIFFEDISWAADGGIWAELLKVGQKDDHVSLSYGSTYENKGWDGIADKGADYVFKANIKNVDVNKNQLIVSLVADDGTALASEKIKVEGTDWQRIEVPISTIDKKRPEGILNCRLQLQLKKEGYAQLNFLSLMPVDTYKGHGMRKDIAEAIAAIQPKFVRFPGGCMAHGDGLDNIYNWKESVGPIEDRKQAHNIWGYNQSRRLGYYEYFQWCEDMGAEPLPVVAAGVPCQNSAANKDGLGGQQGGIPFAKEIANGKRKGAVTMESYIQDVLDLIEWANGDPATSKWARMRADAGHPAPFNLKMIGIGNEDLVSTAFEERYLAISYAVKAKYPNIQVIGTVGPFHYPSSDYIEGWKISKAAKVNKQKGKEENLFYSVDEHYYEQPGWFVNHQDYYDNYDRTAPKVYLGEYASRGKDETENAIAEGIYLTSVERNGDIVDMSSYAPLLSRDGHSNWSPDMIYFDGSKVRLSKSYDMQKLFATHAGDTYIYNKVELNLPENLRKWVGTSVVKDSKTGKTWLKIVNGLPQQLSLKDASTGKSYTVKSRSAEAFEL